MLRAAGRHLGVRAVFHDEVRDSDRHVRPDYGVSVSGAISGYVEVKAPGRAIDPGRFSGHDRRQWERQRDLPNLLYTSGTRWRLYRNGERHSQEVVLEGDLATAGRDLCANPGLEALLTDFLRWKPSPITSVNALVRAVAPLTRLLRGEVLDQLSAERRAIAAGADTYSQPFTGLAADWRALLFPQAEDTAFADGYAQAVTFALLLARTDGMSIEGVPLHQIGAALTAEHSLMGKALQLLTDEVAADFRVTLDLLVRIVDAVDWPRVRSGKGDTYLHLYEHFLDLYDRDLRKKSGSYYTPRDVVEQMVRLTEDVLVTRLGKVAGFRDPDVLTVDPAMGTGTYLHTILERTAKNAVEVDGPGAVAGAVSEVAERLVGFELQMGPYAVAELRTADLLASYDATPPRGGMRIYVTDTLDDPEAAEAQLGSGLQLIAASRRKANRVKARSNVTVVIGNPPYKELAVGLGGWVESGDAPGPHGRRPILEDFFVSGGGRFKNKLKNLYIYFWRWATWKVWESTRETGGADAGIVCFISTSGYLTGPAFAGMREYLRRHATEGWIIDLTPEGQTPDVPTRIFPGVRQPLAIGLFVRTPGTDRERPAPIRYRSVSGRQVDKFVAMAGIRLDDNGWRLARAGWSEPLTPAAQGGWDTYPALSDLMPWYSPGVFPTRTWVYAPDAETLRRRWRALLSEDDREVQATMFKEGRDATLTKTKDPLPGTDTHAGAGTRLREDRATRPSPVRVGYRFLDRQWILPDSRLMDMPRRDLWAARVPGQVFVVEQHSQAIDDGPGLVASSLIPDFHHYNGRGGRTLPFLHPDGSPNLAPRLASTLSTALGVDVTPAHLLAYVAGVVAHSAYTRRFADELTTPGVRVPVTADRGLWRAAVGLGEQVIWLHTYGTRFDGDGRAHANVRFPLGDVRQPLCIQRITGMPDSISYDAVRRVVVMGDGQFGPVDVQVWNYAVGGRNVVRSWFNYRRREPGGKKTSPLNAIHATSWDPGWTTEAIDLLTVLTRLVELDRGQAALLERILAGPLLSLGDLDAAGIGWPRAAKDRRPRYRLGGGLVES